MYILFTFSLEIDVCDPNPCGLGNCSITNEKTPHCSCPSSFYSGNTCEEGRLVVSDIPILTANQLSLPISLYSSPRSTLNITISTQPNVLLYPSDKISITYPNEQTSLQIKSTSPGIVKLHFQLETVEKYEPVNDQIAVVSDENVTGHYFDDDEMGILIEGCCQVDWNLPEYFCLNPTHLKVTLYSSCGWMRNKRRAISDGVIIIEYGMFKVPLSIVGIDIALSDENIVTDFSTGLCERCSKRERNCHSHIPTIEDVRDMLKHQALEKTFLTWSAAIFPSSITVSIPVNTTKQTFSRTDYYAKLVTRLDSLDECPYLIRPIEHSSGLDYVIAVSSDLSISYNQEVISYVHLSGDSPVCFMRSLCNNNEDGITVGITNTLNRKLLNIPSFQKYVQKGWNITLFSITTSIFGLGLRQSTVYWDGISETTLKHSAYDTLLNLKLSGKFRRNFLTVTFFFVGLLTTVSGNEDPLSCSVRIAILLSEELQYFLQIPMEMKGKMKIEIVSGVPGHTSTLYLHSNNGNALYVTDGKCDVNFNINY